MVDIHKAVEPILQAGLDKKDVGGAYSDSDDDFGDSGDKFVPIRDNESSESGDEEHGHDGDQNIAQSSDSDGHDVTAVETQRDISDTDVNMDAEDEDEDNHSNL